VGREMQHEKLFVTNPNTNQNIVNENQGQIFSSVIE